MSNKQLRTQIILAALLLALLLSSCTVRVGPLVVISTTQADWHLNGIAWGNDVIYSHFNCVNPDGCDQQTPYTAP